MEKLVDDGLVCAIGISNFSIRKIEVQSSSWKPATEVLYCQLQKEHHSLWSQSAALNHTILEGAAMRACAGLADVCPHQAGRERD